LPKKHTLTLPSETLEIDKMKMGWKNGKLKTARPARQILKPS
jgi:hypothetical protein